jgi:UDP-N-acetylglucosamine 2-epimerase (non-hydrolysing)
MKILVIIGTRPEAIKMAPVISSLRQAGIKTLVCASGQHREMLTQTLEVFSLRPDIALDVMQPAQTLNSLSARLLIELDRVYAEEKPDCVLVQGDTTTAMCGGLAAFHRGIRVGHIEAGLRTGDLSSPFPEEANRSLLARIANLHFAPTAAARDALLQEGISAKTIHVTGNTVVDAIGLAQSIINNQPPQPLLQSIYDKTADRPMVLITCHRRENFGGPLEAICQMIRSLCERYNDYHWVFPVHLNPNVSVPVHRILADISNLTLLAPVDYLTSLSLIAHASLVVSDSGGIQEEAPSFGVPVVVMRNHTERQEGVNAGFATLAGQDPATIEKAVCSWLDDVPRRAALQKSANPYGDGHASQRIVAILNGQTYKAFNE